MTSNYMPTPVQIPQDELLRASFDACKRMLRWAQQIWPGIGIADDIAKLNRLRQELPRET